MSIDQSVHAGKEGGQFIGAADKFHLLVDLDLHQVKELGVGEG